MYYRTRKGFLRAVDDVSFDVNRGDTFGLVGESACGKTSVAFSIMNLLPDNGEIVGGQIRFDGKNLVGLSDDEMREIRWKKLSMIFQSAMNSLNPVLRIGDQLVDVVLAHENIPKKEAKDRVADFFEMVGLPRHRMNNYAHEFSGGMKQRAVIAMSLLCNPNLIIADEPTTALDVVIQDQILQVINDIQSKLNFAVIMISHNMSVVAETCNKIAVMYAGEIMELADSTSIFDDTRHPYTMVLIKAFPSIRGPLRKLVSVGGSPPSLLHPPPACRFEPRCPFAEEVCRREKPALKETSHGHYSQCHFALDPKLRKGSIKN